MDHVPGNVEGADLQCFLKLPKPLEVLLCIQPQLCIKGGTSENPKTPPLIWCCNFHSQNKDIAYSVNEFSFIEQVPYSAAPCIIDSMILY